LGGRKGIQPVKNLSGGVMAWLSVWGQVRFAYSPADVSKSRLVLPSWFYLQATGYESQHIWCLSQARINWEGCVRKSTRRKNGGDGTGGGTN